MIDMLEKDYYKRQILILNSLDAIGIDSSDWKERKDIER